MKQNGGQGTRAFTLVELMVVIAVIAILASLSVVTYRGVKDRATDTRRASDIAAIKEMLGAYEVAHKGVPTTSAYTSVKYRGWDASLSPNWLSFLRPYGTMPVDPVNTMVNDDGQGMGNFVYHYYCYPTPSPHVKLGYFKTDGTRVQDDFAVRACLDSV